MRFLVIANTLLQSYRGITGVIGSLFLVVIFVGSTEMMNSSSAAAEITPTFNRQLQLKNMQESGWTMPSDLEETEAVGRRNWYQQQQHPAPGCECWHWPDCINNCSSHPLMKAHLITNGALLSRLPLPFVIVLPYQEKRSHFVHNTSTASRRGTFYMHTKFWLHMLDRKLIKLDLLKSRVFGDQPNSYSTHYYQQNKDGRMYAIASNKLDHCFYIGTVVNESLISYAAVDTCYGLRGLIQVTNKTYGILPLRCPQCSRGQLPHVLFYHQSSPIDRDARLPVFWQPTNMLSLRPRSHSGGSRWNPAAGAAIYTLRLSVLLDHRLFVSFDRKLEQSVHYIGSIVNQATKSFQGTAIDIRLVRSEIWTMENHIPLPKLTGWNVSIKVALNELATYSIQRISRSDSTPDGSSAAGRGLKSTPVNRLSDEVSPGGTRRPSIMNPRLQRRASASATAPNPSFPFRLPATPSGFNQPHDFQVLLTLGQSSEKHVEYLAVPDSICTPRSLAVIQVNISETVYHVSRLLSLAIAEVLGIRAFPCPSRHNCDASDLFSEGDRRRLSLALMVGMADCLLPMAQQSDESNAASSLMPHDTCGNGQLDRGEECDPAMLSFTSATTGNQSRRPAKTRNNRQPPLLPCCNPDTCLVDAGAACVHGECCDRCQLVRRGRICRQPRDRCDLPEFCTGTEASCPVDLYLENGTPCHSHLEEDRKSPGFSTSAITSATDSSALCYHGVCPTRESQCRLIWGESALKADDYCFSQHNTRTEGACGIPGEQCQPEHAVCGLLHCQGGEPRPVAPEAQAGQPFLTYTEHHGQQFECKHLSLDSSVRFVPEGAACDATNNRYCFQQQCVSPTVLLHSKCPSASRGPVHTPSDNNTNALCANNGVCTNFGFCLCRPGWTGKACDVIATTANRRNNYTAGKHQLFDMDLNLLALESDMVTRIWTYLDEAVSTAGGSSSSGSLSTEATRPILNTMSLVLILVSVAGGIFVCLVVFVLCYRRRSRPGFPHKPNSGGCSAHCFFYSAAARRWHHRGPGAHTHKSLFTRVDADTGGGGSSSIRLLETNSVNSSSRLVIAPDDRDAYPQKVEARTDDKRLKWHRKGKRESSRRHNSSEDTGGRRRRRHRHRRRRGHNHINVTSVHHHSDTEVTTATTTSAITFRDGDHPGDEENSLDRIIKFGSMPSYREDKRKRHFQQSTTVCPGDSSDPHKVIKSANETVPSHPMPASPFLLISSVSTPASNPPRCQSQLISQTSESSAVYHEMPPPPLFSITDGSEAKAKPPHSFSVDSATNAEHLMVEVAGRIGAAAAIRRLEVEREQNKHLGHSLGNSRSVAPDAESISSTHLDILLENSWRPPEKGILKNRNEGGGHVVTGKVTKLSATSTTATASSANCRQTGRRHHRGRRTQCRDDDDERCASRDNAGVDDYHLRSTRSTSVCSDGGHSIPGRDYRHRSSLKHVGSRELLFGLSSSTNSSTSSSSGSSTSGDSSPAKMGSKSSETGSTVSSSSSAAIRSTSRHRRQRVFTNDTESPERKHISRHSNSRIGCDNSKTGNGRRYRCSSVGDKTADANSSLPTVSTTGRLSNFHSSSSCSSGPTTTTTTTSTLESGADAAVAGHQHWRRCRGRRRQRRRTGDDDDVTSGSQCSNSPLQTAPTILCNAGQQTDEISSFSTPAADKRTTSRLGNQREKRVEESNSEWEECSASACEECQVATSHTGGATVGTADGTRLAAPSTSHRLHNISVCLPSGARESVSAASTTSDPRKCSLVSPSGPPAQVHVAARQPHPTDDSGKLHEGLLLLSPSSSSNRFGASSSSTASSSVGGAVTAAGKAISGGDRMQPTGFRSPGFTHHGSSNDDQVCQNSDPEVDAHLIAAARANLHKQLPHRLPTAAAALCQSPDDTFGYVVVGAPGRPSALRNNNMVVMGRLPDANSSYFPRRGATEALPGPGGETFYEQQQHPYEEVATDDYADASCGNFTAGAASQCPLPPLQHQQQQHIYYQHGLMLMVPDSDGCDSAAAVAPLTDEDERLSLDDGGVSRGTLGSHFDNAGSMPPVPDGLWSGLGTPVLTTNGLGQLRQFNMPSTRNNQSVDCHRRPNNAAIVSQPVGGDDGDAEFALSAFRRAGDNRIATTHSRLLTDGKEPLSGCRSSPPVSGTHFNKLRLSAVRDNPLFGRQPPFSLSSEAAAVPCYGLQSNNDRHINGSVAGGTYARQEARSNDGTCNDGSSDTSSLPEAGCDLVQLAQLGGAGCSSTTAGSAAGLNQYHLMSRRY